MMHASELCHRLEGCPSNHALLQYYQCSAAVLHYLDTHAFLDPDALKLVFHNFAFFLSLTDFCISLVGLYSPLQLVCFLTCTAGHVWYGCKA